MGNQFILPDSVRKEFARLLGILIRFCSTLHQVNPLLSSRVILSGPSLEAPRFFLESDLVQLKTLNFIGLFARVF